MEACTVIAPGLRSEKLQRMISQVGNGGKCELVVIREKEDWPDSYANCKLVFAIELDEIGCDNTFHDYLKHLYKTRPSFEGASAVLLLNASTEFYSKTFAKQIIFAFNHLGLRFIGKPLVEALPSEINLKTWQKHLPGTRKDILDHLCRDLGARLMSFHPKATGLLKLMVLHNSEVSTSNSLQLAHVVLEHLQREFENIVSINEIRIEDGAIHDCRGCGFQTCLAFAEKKACYYSGDKFDLIFSAIEETDSILWVCPNYNDSVSASLMAAINRMSGMSRTIHLDEKSVYGIVVSANSGGDSVAMQLIDGLCINKGFQLPPEFALIEIANDPLSVLENIGIEERIAAFVSRMVP